MSPKDKTAIVLVFLAIGVAVASAALMLPYYVMGCSAAIALVALVIKLLENQGQLHRAETKTAAPDATGNAAEEAEHLACM